MSTHPHHGLFFFYDHQGHAFHPIRDGDVCGRAGGGAQIVPQAPASGEVRTLSRHQFKVSVARNEVFVEDLGARVRTKVNGVELRPGFKRKVLLGDLVEVPGTRLVLTNQTEHVPGYTQDRDSGEIAGKRPVAMREDGEMTTTIRPEQTRTLFLVPKEEYRKVAVKDFVRSQEPVHERRRSRLWLVLASIAAIAGAWLIHSQIGKVAARIPATTTDAAGGQKKEPAKSKVPSRSAAKPQSKN